MQLRRPLKQLLQKTKKDQIQETDDKIPTPEENRKLFRKSYQMMTQDVIVDEAQ